MATITIICSGCGAHLGKLKDDNFPNDSTVDGLCATCQKKLEDALKQQERLAGFRDARLGIPKPEQFSHDYHDGYITAECGKRRWGTSR